MPLASIPAPRAFHQPQRPWLTAAKIASLAADLELRDHQVAALQAVASRIAADPTAVSVVQMPPGGGKTLVGCALATAAVMAGRNCLWLCHRGQPLAQAAEALRRLPEKIRPDAYRLGCDDGPLSRLPAGPGEGVCLTTPGTWLLRRDDSGVVFAPDRLVVVHDEVHWAYDAPTGRAVRGPLVGTAPIIGLSATPPRNGPTVAYTVRPDELVGRFLAAPMFRWLPESGPALTGRPSSTEAAHLPAVRTPRRVSAIVGEISRGFAAGEWQKVVVFTADIPHAERLVAGLNAAGVAAAAVHSVSRPGDLRDAMSGFASGRLRALVTVELLAEGYDLPAIDCVVLARRTGSLRLITQMIGRGARLTPGKSTFTVLDAVGGLDEAELAAVLPPRPTQTATPRLHGDSGTRRKVRHSDMKSFSWEMIELPGGRVPVDKDVTFGVTIGLMPGARPDVHESYTIAAARSMVAASLPTPWKVNLIEQGRLEIESPALRGAFGAAELRRVCGALAALTRSHTGLVRIDSACSLRLNLATAPQSDADVGRLLRLVQRLEPGLFTLVDPGRLYRHRPHDGGYTRRTNNGDCRPIRRLGDLTASVVDRVRYDPVYRHRSVDVTRTHGLNPQVGVRMHHATIEYEKIMGWASLWMILMAHAGQAIERNGVAGPVFPRPDRQVRQGQEHEEDLFKLLQAEGIMLPGDLTAVLADHRRKLIPRWRTAMPARVASWPWSADGVTGSDRRHRYAA